ncbi:MAG: hypothetical protein FWF04_01065 [Clostridiales bacterium]|nr:hypothetical protein [Clostridiales bacterium]
MSEKANEGKMPTRKKVLIWTVSIVGFLALTWCTMLYNDYNRVIRNYSKPAFCINFDPAFQEYRGLRWWEDGTRVLLQRKISERYVIDYGYFQGLFYSVELSGAFLPFIDYDYFLSRGYSIDNDDFNIVSTNLSNFMKEWPARDPKTRDLLTPWPGILQARFMLFGKEIGRVDRPYPPDAGRTEAWQFRKIF